MAQVTGFYTVGEVARLARIKLRTLYDWRQRGIAPPTLRLEIDGKSQDGYSYADLTILRLMRALRDDRIDFEAAVRALRHLYDRLGPPNTGWADAKVYFVGNKIFAERPDDWPITSATESGQTVAEGLFGELFDELRNLEDEWSVVVPQQFRPYVLVNPSVMGGEPVIRNTRIPTATVARLSRGGTPIIEIASYYRNVSRTFLEQAIMYEQYLDDEAAAA